MNSSNVTDWIGALSSMLTAVLTAGLLVAAVWAAKAAVRTLAQMKMDSEGQRADSARATRPYVHARMAPSVAGIDAWDLVIENSGRSAAHDVNLQITPRDGAKVPDDLITQPARRFAHAGHTLHPGVSLRMYWVAGASAGDPTGFPRATVVLRYADGEGVTYEERPVALDPDTIGATPAPFTGAVAGNDADKSISKNTLNSLRAIAHHLGESNR